MMNRLGLGAVEPYRLLWFESTESEEAFVVGIACRNKHISDF